MSYKIDLHSHSIISYDGGITEKEYVRLLEDEVINYIAVTDHNETKFAKELAKRLGDKIIIGEEITSRDGEVIGLFLEETISQGLSAKETVERIHEQGGLVYIPHPFEIFRHGLRMDVLEKIQSEIDIIEVFNARAKWRGKSDAALEFAKEYKIAGAASSDAHGEKGVGTSFSIISETPSVKNLVGLLRAGKLCKQFAPITTYLYPSINRIKHRFGKF